MADETYYSLLEISETAAAAEIKTAYHRLIRDVHPDRLANAPAYWQRQAEEKSKEINEAYTVLSNREKRHLYDAQLASYRGSGNGNGAHTAQSSAPSSPTSSQRRAQTTSRSQSTSGTATHSAQTPGSSASQQHQTASTSTSSANAASQPSSQPFASKLTSGERFFAAFVGCVFAFVAVSGFWNSTSIGDSVFCFLLAGTLLFGVACLYQRQISRVLGTLGVKRPRHQLWATLGIILLVLFVGKIADMNWDTHFRGSDDHSATNAQISQVKIINGSLSDTTVSGNSNEKYPSAYNFTGYIQNNSTATVSFIRMKIRIFDCPETGSPSSHISYGINYQSGIYDPSPPASCNSIGEEEEDDFPSAEPGQSVGFANFYFPNHPKDSLRWNYEIAAMDTREVAASAPTPPNAEDVYYREQPWPGTSRDYIFPDGSIITTPAGYALINNDDGTPAQFNKDGFLYTHQSRVVVSVKEHVGAKVTSTGECVAWSGVCGIVRPVAQGEPTKTNNPPN